MLAAGNIPVTLYPPNDAEDDENGGLIAAPRQGRKKPPPVPPVTVNRYVPDKLALALAKADEPPIVLTSTTKNELTDAVAEEP